VQDANGAAGEEDAGAVEQVENAGAAEKGESAGAVERQENVREAEENIGGASELAGAPETNHSPPATSRRRSADATTPSQKQRQRMVPQIPSNLPGIDPRAFRPQHQPYVGAYPIPCGTAGARFAETQVYWTSGGLGETEKT
jgi:hypothetical protein